MQQPGCFCNSDTYLNVVLPRPPRSGSVVVATASVHQLLCFYMICMLDLWRPVLAINSGDSNSMAGAHQPRLLSIVCILCLQLQHNIIVPIQCNTVDTGV